MTLMPENPASEPVGISLAHSPDSDDAFMFYGLATRKVSTEGLRFAHTLEDIQTLNEKAHQTIYDVTALSFHAYAHVADRYILLPSGASFGDRYGPIVVARGTLSSTDLKNRRIAVPGLTTTACLALRLFEPEVETLIIPFDKIMDAVAAGEADAGLVIHEGQLTYGVQGLSKVIDLGEWWHQQTGLPLPLGGNAARRSLGPDLIRRISRVFRASIRYGLEHREEALEYAAQFARGLDAYTADKFVSMYVNDWTLDYGEQGRRAVQILLDRAFDRGLIPLPVLADFAAEEAEMSSV